MPTDPLPAPSNHAPSAEIVAAPTPEKPAIDPVDAQFQDLIDEDQMHEITALVDAADTASDAVVPGQDSAAPLARLELRLADYDDRDLQRVVKESEAVVIAEMVRTGQLTSEGELTDRDIASMIFLAYTSEEMLAELRLRKSLDQAPAGLDATTGNDFAPLKNIE